MAVFRFACENYWLALPGGSRWTNGMNRIIEVEEGPVANAIRRCRHADELSFMPPDVARSFIEASNDGAAYPIPDVGLKPCVLIGRGLSSRGFEDRFPRDQYYRVGINPGSIPYGARPDGIPNDPTDGMHCDKAEEFDLIFTLDAFYLKEASNFTQIFKGPVVGPPHIKHDYRGPGTFHAINELDGLGVGISFAFALSFLANAGAGDIILCGVDLLGVEGGAQKEQAIDTIERFKEVSRIWREEVCALKEVEQVWEFQNVASRD